MDPEKTILGEKSNTFSTQMDPEKNILGEKSTDLGSDAKTHKNKKRNRNILIASACAGSFLLLLLLFVFWYKSGPCSFGSTSGVMSNELSDSRRVYFTRILKQEVDDHTREIPTIFSIDQGGENEKQLVSSCSICKDLCYLMLAAVSPDGEFIAFDCAISGNTFVIRKDGTGLKCIGPGRAQVFSPNSKYLVVESQDRSTISIKNLSGKLQYSWPFPKDLRYVYQFSQDGQFLFFEKGNELYKVDPKTGLTIGNTAAFPGKVSPDGQKILLTSGEKSYKTADASSNGLNGSDLKIPNSVGYPTWSQNGMNLLVIEKHQDDYKALIAVLDSKRENVVEFKTVVTTNTAEIKW